MKMIYIGFCLLRLLLIFLLKTSQTSAFSVDVTTYPNGPIYKAGTEYSVFCSVASEDYSYYSYYDYEWSRGCSYTNQFTSFNPSSDIIGEYSTTPVTCQNVYRCRVTDEYYDTAIGEVTIETVTDIAIQILLSPISVYPVQNVSILTVSASGQFIDVVCNTGLKQPNIGQWINPNGTDIAFDDETLEVQRGGGIISLPYTTLKLRDGHSLDPQDTGLYTCKMPDINMVERESHIWILPEQDFKPADPEYFISYSGQNSLKMTCAYSNTPGEITWYKNYYYFEANNRTTISQRLTQSSPVIYEGVLELDYIDAYLIADCTMYSSIIRDTSDEFPEIIYADHFFILSWIGQSETFYCPFLYYFDDDIVTTQIFTNGEVVKTEFDSFTWYDIDQVKDITHNQHYSCIGITMDNEKYYFNATIVGLIPAFPLTMHIALVPVIAAGESLRIDLIAIKNSGFTYDQTISCTDDKGVPINDLEGFMHPNNPKTTGLTLHYEVPIETVTLSHAGLYLCTAFLETPSQLDNISDNSSFAIRIIAPEPDFVFINSMEDEATIILNAGTISLFNCTATLDTEFVDTPVSSIVHWMIGDTLIESHDRFNITETTSEDMNDTIAFYSELEIAPVLIDDKGVLVCRVFIIDNSSNEYILDSQAISSSVNLNVEGSEALASQAFQLLLSGLDGTHSSKLNSSHYLDLITNEIVTILMLKCNCQYSNKYIKQQHFIIQTEHSTGLVTYRAILYGTAETAATALIEYIQDWINTDGLLLTETEGIITVDENCKLVISSFDSILCDNLEVSATTTPVSSPSPIASSGQTATQIGAEAHTSVSHTTQMLNDNTASSANTETIAVNTTDNSGSQLQVMLLLIVGICGILVCFLIIICILGLTLFITMKKSKKRKQQYVTHSGLELYQEISHGLPNDYEMYTRQLPKLPNTEDNDLKKKLHNSDIDSEIYMEMVNAGSDKVAEEIYDTETTYEYIEQRHISDYTEL